MAKLKKKTKENLKKASLIAGAVALMGAGAYAVFGMGEKKMIVQYGHVNDQEYAETLAEKFNAELVFDPLFGWESGFGNIDKPVVFIGGQYSNPSVNQLTDMGIFETVTSTNPGTVQVGKVRGFDVFLVAGWESADTQQLVNMLIENGKLPSQTKEYFK